MSDSQFSHLNSSLLVRTEHVDMSNSQPNMFLDFEHESPLYFDVGQIETLTETTVDNSLASHHSFEFLVDQVPLSQINGSPLVEGQDDIGQCYTDDQVNFNESTMDNGLASHHDIGQCYTDQVNFNESTMDNGLASHHSFEFPTDQMPLSQISRSRVEGQDNNDRCYTNQVTFNEVTPFGVEGICNGESYNIETMMGEFANPPITSSCSSLRTAKKKGWTEDEHKLFLLGLKKYGKGDWKSIARNYVTTRSSTQVASHAQKYFKRRNESTTRRKRASIHDIVDVGKDYINVLAGKGLLSPDKVLFQLQQKHIEEANIASNIRLESHLGQQQCVHFHQQIDEANIVSSTRLESHVEQQHCVQFNQQIDESNIASNTRLESHIGQQHCVQFHQQIDESNIASDNTRLESHVGQQHCVQFHQQIDESNIASNNTRLESHVGQQHSVQFHQQIDESNIASNTRLTSLAGQQHYVSLHQQLDEVMCQSYQDYCGTNTSSSSSFQTQSPWDPPRQLQWP